MDWDGKVSTTHFVCSDSARQLVPGETFFSGLLPGGELGFARVDIAAERWDGYDKSLLVSWWRQKVPQPGQERKLFRLNLDTLQQIFANLREAGSREQQCLAYVVALALVRARRLRLLQVANTDGRSTLVIEERDHRTTWRLHDPELSEQDQQRVLDNLLSITGDADPVEG